jgi:hypothetical protein
MGSRLDLHDELLAVIGNNNVYFQPPPKILMKYPAIRYKLSDIDNKFADDGVYLSTKKYEVIVIDEDPDSEIPDKINQAFRARFDRMYVADNLNHWSFTISY